jgi:hypothetical protein
MRLSRLEKEFHGKTAASCFNMAWDYLDAKKRNEEDDRTMLNLAHSSRFHWGLVGSPENQAVGDWQISRIYAALGQASLSLKFAKSSLETCKRDGLQGMLCTAYEAMARAYAVSGEPERARRHIVKAREALDASSKGREDRKIFLNQILETESMIRGQRAPRNRNRPHDPP